MTSPVPVTVLTGFLGAGKTTLLNAILSGDHGLAIGVLVNDFGAINIDERLVVGMDDKTISLANGCVCCQIDDELVDAVAGLIERPERPEYIVLEASGVADPMGIALTLGNDRVADTIRLDAIVSVIDVDQVFELPELLDLKLRQVGFSDIALLNKVDLVEPDQLEAVHDWIDEHIPRVRKIETTYCNVPLDLLLDVGDGIAATHSSWPAHDEAAHAPAAFRSFTYTAEQPVSTETLRALIKKLPGYVIRCKGLIATQEHPDQAVVLQAVGRRSTFDTRDVAPGWSGRTEIVIIGTANDFDPAELGQLFDSHLMP